MTFMPGDKVLINGAQLAEITYYDEASNWMCWDALGAPGIVSKCSNHISHTRVEYQGGHKPAATDGVERDIFGQPLVEPANEVLGATVAEAIRDDSAGAATNRGAGPGATEDSLPDVRLAIPGATEGDSDVEA